MTDKDTLAELITLAGAAYRKRDLLSLDRDWQDEKIRQLNRFGVLSIGAIASILGVSLYRVRKALGPRTRSSLRGQLNPAHLSMLGYALSAADISPEWVHEMTEHGTSISTISDLTQISEATLYRRKNHV